MFGSLVYLLSMKQNRKAKPIQYLTTQKDFQPFQHQRMHYFVDGFATLGKLFTLLNFDNLRYPDKKMSNLTSYSSYYCLIDFSIFCSVVIMLKSSSLILGVSCCCTHLEDIRSCVPVDITISSKERMISQPSTDY